MFRKYIVIILMFSASSVHAGGATDNAINSAVNNAMPHVNSAIEDWAMRNVPQLKLIEVETRLRNYSKTDYRILGLLELQRSDNEAYLSQFSLSSFQSRETLNLGLVWRKLSPNNTLMYGGNVFYDREFNTDHSRIGFGLELKSSVYDLNFNLYEALSDKETVDGALEEAADGYDLEVAMYLPYLPWAKAYYKVYEWDSSIYDIKHGEVLSIQLQPTGRVSLEVGIHDDNTMSNDREFIKVNYVLCCNNETTNQNFMFISPVAYSYQSVEKRFYEKVRRENNMVKGVKGAVVLGRGS